MTTKARKPRTPKPEPSGLYVGSTITPGEGVGRFSSYDSRNASLIARAAVQTMATAANINTTVCAMQRLRLYRPTSAKGGKLWRGRSVGSKRMEFLRGDFQRGGMMVRPSAKAVEYADDAGDIEEVTDGPIIDLLRKPDPTMLGNDTIAGVFWYLEATGECYLWKGERSEGAPSSLYTLPPQWCVPVPSETEFISGYRYGRNSSRQVVYPADDVLYLRHRIDPQNPLRGVSWPQTMTMEGDVENAALRAEIARWTNGGNPGLVVIADAKTTDTQVEQAITNINKQVRGVSKAGGVLVLRNCTVESIGGKPKDMDYVNGMARVEAQIRKAAGIPESIWEMGSASLASAYQADPQYMGYTINPRCQKVADHFNELLRDFGIEPGEYWLAFDNPVAEDVAALELSTREDVKVGIITPNEARAVRGYDAFEDAHSDVLCFNGVPVATLVQQASALSQPQDAGTGTDAQGGTEAPAAGAVPPGGDVQATAMNGAQTVALAELAAQVSRDDLPRTVAMGIARAAFPTLTQENLDEIFPPELEGYAPTPEPAPTDGQQQSGSNTPKTPAPVSDGSKSATNDEGGTGVGGASGKVELKTVEIHTKDDRLLNQPPRVTQALDDLQAQVESWYRAAMSGGIGEGGAVSLAPFRAMLAEIMDSGIRNVVALAAADAVADPRMPEGASFDLPANPHAVEWARTEAAKRVVDIEATLEAKLRQAVTDGQAASETIAQTQARIQAEAPEFSANRAETIARTETSGAANEGARMAYAANGVTRKDFILAGGPCALCSRVRLKYPDPIGIGEYWDVDGEPMSAPPLHPNCRCTLVPVFEEGWE